MTALRIFSRNRVKNEATPIQEVAPLPAPLPPSQPIELDIAEDDPLLDYLQKHPSVIEVEKLNLDSPALRQLRAASVRLIVPLVSQGELIGLINLGHRLSEQDYSSDDRKLLSDLAGQAAPALRVAQLVRQQQLQAAERERMEQELRVARLIQQTLLPQDVPHIEGYDVTAFYRPAQAVGGDFYDFLYFPDGQIGFVIGDVTDKGVPAALVMASTRAILRAAAERLVSPGAVLQRTNEVLQAEIPPKMFVTCLYALLDPASGRLRYANAGHDVPYRRTADGAVEMRATGMPLGLLPGMDYEEKEATLAPGESLLLYSDGLVEAHDPRRGMFGFPRLQGLMGEHPGGEGLVPFLLEELERFTGPGWEQEDDVTMVTLQRAHGSPNGERMLDRFSVPSQPGNERQAMERVAAVAAELPLPPGNVDRLKTAVAEATMNAMEHGNQYQADVPVEIEVAADQVALFVRVTDKGGDKPIPEAQTPDLLAKLDGLQSPRGWGLFLIEKMVDEMRTHSEDGQHTIELVMRLGDDHQGDKDAKS
jgi:serine phosphatase RsbU (regulator of sigma subunit)/anti-sigma regulatory factor (Ser/Thr protein kinase)